MTDPDTGRPRVMVVSRCATSFGPSRGGVDVLAQRHAMLLADDAEVVYVGLRPVNDPRVRNVPVRSHDLLPESFGASAYVVNEGFHVVLGALKALRTEREIPADLVVSNSSISTLVLKLLGRRPVVHYIHDGLYQPEGAGGPASEKRKFTSFVVNNLLEKLAIRMADKVICASQGIAQQVVSGGTPEEKLTVMYPVLRRLDRMVPSLNGAAVTLPASVLGPAPFILSVGQQTGRKRFDLAIRALRHLPPEYQLVLVGMGPLHETYQALAESEGLKDRVVFLNAVGDEVLDLLYQSCAAYVLASENEGFPITVAEALTHGRPVVLACPSAGALAAALANDYFVVLPELSETGIALAVQAAVERDARDPKGMRRTIRRWAHQQFPTESDIRHDYARIFEALLPGDNDPPAPGAVA
jgi:glycosyltransferase involved in cell wall biosynthesis